MQTPKPPIEEVAQCNSQLPRLYSLAMTENALMLVASLIGTNMVAQAGELREALHMAGHTAELLKEHPTLIISLFRKLRQLVAETPE